MRPKGRLVLRRCGPLMGHMAPWDPLWDPLCFYASQKSWAPNHRGCIFNLAMMQIHPLVFTFLLRSHVNVQSTSTLRQKEKHKYIYLFSRPKKKKKTPISIEIIRNWNMCFMTGHKKNVFNLNESNFNSNSTLKSGIKEVRSILYSMRCWLGKT